MTEVDRERDTNVGEGGDTVIEAEYSDQTQSDNISSWFDPEVPRPNELDEKVENKDGWEAIDRLGRWDAHLSKIPTLEEVPHQFRQIWTRAYIEVVRKI